MHIYVHAFIPIIDTVFSKDERQFVWPFVRSYGANLLNADELANRHEPSIDKVFNFFSTLFS
jgi:hypothetical protein